MTAIIVYKVKCNNTCHHSISDVFAHGVYKCEK